MNQVGSAAQYSVVREGVVHGQPVLNPVLHVV